MTENGALTVGQVAEKFGITVRTLHHYDEIALVVPSERSRAGYRLYTADDLTRLQNVVVYRRLGFALDEIASMVDGSASGDDLRAHLNRQKAAVMTRLGELHELVDAIDRALETAMSDQPLTPQEMKELFGDGFDESYQAEAEERWGESDAWKQSAARTKSFTKADWQRVKDQGQAVLAAFAACVDAGQPADSDEAAAAAELHRASIETFYDCSHAFQVNLAEMYVADPRFAATYDAVRPGMAQYVRDAIVANATRHAAG
jgi:MerR family transcriptional regulator, thiopeptide resistance regulator